MSHERRVALLGDGPAIEAARAALSDATDARPIAGERAWGALAEASLGIVAGVVGSDGFGRANRLATDAGVPWLAVEVGGVGGRAFDDVTAAVTGFGPGAGCYECLRARVTAAAGEEEEPSPSATAADVRLAGAVAGREAVRALPDGAAAIAGRVREVDGPRRTFLPAPDCAVCGPRDHEWGLDRSHREASLDDALERAERGVDDRLGIVTDVGENESFPAPYYLARLCDTGPFSDATAARQAAGVDADWDRAYVKALGEAFERYAAGVYRERSFVERAPGALADAVPPSAFVRPADAPDPDADEPLAWVPGERLDDGERVHLPAASVVFPPPERRFRPPITTGLGLGNSPVEALVSGLTEVIERDAAMLAWYSTFEPLGLAVDADGFATLARRARSEGLSVVPLLLTQDVDVPAVACAVRREEGWPRLALGSAAGLDAAAAARDALAEALQNWMELRAMGPDRAAEAGGAIGRYAGSPAALDGFLDPETTVAAADVGPREPPTGPAALDALVERAAAAGIETYAARLTPRDVDALGFEAVRVLAPRAQPLFVDEPFFGERAREIPRSLGFRPRLDRPFHPFP